MMPAQLLTDGEAARVLGVSPDALDATAIRDATVIAAYTRDRLNTEGSGTRAGVSKDTARRILTRYGIPRRQHMARRTIGEPGAVNRRAPP
jgi:hypothetical protein